MSRLKPVDKGRHKRVGIFLLKFQQQGLYLENELNVHLSFVIIGLRKKGKEKKTNGLFWQIPKVGDLTDCCERLISGIVLIGEEQHTFSNPIM